jgi:hypothetical protein
MISLLLAQFGICSHPAKWLHFEKHHTSEPIDEDFKSHTYHLYCTACNKPVKISYAECLWISEIKGGPR